jgi:hypothetical protein
MSPKKPAHSNPRVKARPVPKPPTVATELLDIRRRLALAQAIAYVTSAALKAQNADSDREASLVLQRCVGDELDRLIERIDALALAAGGVAP